MNLADELLARLDRNGLADWHGDIDTLLRERLTPGGRGAHGELASWLAVLDGLPDMATEGRALDQPVVSAAGATLAPDAAEALTRSLLQLLPWRKGPFEIHGVFIDTEWRSDWKWDRVAPVIAPLGGRRVLDVGCGNGYYAYRMIGAGASSVVGIDPTLKFLFQFLTLDRYLAAPEICLLPLRLEDLPRDRHCFDTTFSMGVLYHRREPREHLAELLGTLRAGGELILETLVLPGDAADVCVPDGRYARMRNVWSLPTAMVVGDWLRAAGFSDIRLVDVSVTTTDEQRSTDWMPFDSLAEALDPADPSLTVEGLPAPQRAVFVCQAP